MGKSKIHSPRVILFFLLVSFFLPPLLAQAFSDEEIHRVWTKLEREPTGERIAYWAERFMGIPYDRDPQGIYVTKAVIVADKEVDCMYLTFRAVELALSRTPEEAIQIALDKRFHHRGVLQDGKVVNYEDRFQYGEDMIQSGKWGKELTFQLGRTTRIPGSRGQEFFEILPRPEILGQRGKLKSGDLLFFMKAPDERVVEEGVGHIGVVKVEGKGSQKRFFLIHAGGTKSSGGKVKKIPLKDYLSQMPFVGVRVTRFE